MQFRQRLSKTQATTNFENQLIELHVLLFEFLASVMSFLGARGAQRAFKAVWNPEDFASFESKCDQVATKIEIEASNCDREVL